jgi:hypothetical protein
MGSNPALPILSEIYEKWLVRGGHFSAKSLAIAGLLTVVGELLVVLDRLYKSNEISSIVLKLVLYEFLTYHCDCLRSRT